MSFAFWIINRDTALAQRWESVLRLERWTVHRAPDLEAFAAVAEPRASALVLLDLAALGSAPAAALAGLKERMPALALILTSGAPVSNERIIETLEAGVDDFFPADIDEGLLKAKLRAHLRRLLPSLATAMDVVRSRSGDLRVDRSSWQVAVRGKDGKYAINTALTRTEIELLALFLERPGAAMERRFIVEKVWKDEAEAIRPGTVDKHIESLRRKLGRLGAHIRTVYGVGYAFREEP